MTAAPGKSAGKRSPARLFAAAIAFVALVCVGISIAMYTPTEADHVEDQVNTMVNAFEKEHVGKFLSGTADEVKLRIGGEETPLNKMRQEVRLTRFYGWADKVSISPKEMTVRVKENTATVTFPFTYSMRNSSMLGFAGKKNPTAIIFLKKTNDKWIMTELELAIP